jgi:hypothetical protein
LTPVRDGRIDPLASGTLLGSLSRKPYTVVILNVAFLPWRSPQLHDNLRRDPLFPAELARSLFV